ncbi:MULTISPECIES: tail fiber assembly protein [Enterobacteriaceae]|uniref:Phage tail fibre assembly protein n=3 Tax=Enterobacteriaceae TaxID=543 RepID=D2TJ17_CITRI|nr:MULTISPECIES: tail fiber assembly protein [Enterobacteriaceae]MEC9680443.1 tail fiber assembly protein [Escherichia marmotae]AEJ56048.1 caudovirales tail fiber assembly family protein [Escherichia coli UMNF18]EEQ2015328.1 tail fiber assembly protein [Escherichia coli]EEQ2797494.1 tail fiber assembly protein [Escherichia coli]EEQ3832517.1 tail fiber assembly protein [Escherichia coli]
MTFKMSAEAQTIRVFNYLDGTNEFIGESDAYIPPHTGLPANSTDIAPPDIPAGFAAVFNADEMKWHLMEDHRGKTVYSTETGVAVTVSELGSLPENVTSVSPDGEYQRWNGSQWVTDEEARRNALINQAAEKKAGLLKQMGEQIAVLQDAVDFGEATPEEQEQLTALRKLRIKLNRIQPENAPDIDWSDFE